MKKKKLRTRNLQASAILAATATLSACSSTPGNFQYDESDRGSPYVKVGRWDAEPAGYRTPRVEVEEIRVSRAVPPAEKSPEGHVQPPAVVDVHAEAPVPVAPDAPLRPPVPSEETSRVVAHAPPTTPAVYPPVGGDETSRAPANEAEAVAELIRGNERFVTGALKTRDPQLLRREALEGRAQVHTIVLACSDSLISPELVFDQKPGELFVIRVAGNVLGSAQVASIEYAIEQLGAKALLVLGHESCGAVRTALHLPKGQTTGSTDLDWLAEEIRPVVSQGRVPASMIEAADPQIRGPVKANVDHVSQNLYIRSAVVRRAVDSKKLRLLRGIQSHDQGRVEFWK